MMPNVAYSIFLTPGVLMATARKKDGNPSIKRLVSGDGNSFRHFRDLLEWRGAESQLQEAAAGRGGDGSSLPW